MFQALPSQRPRGKTLSQQEAALRKLTRERVEADGVEEAGDNPRIEAGYTYLGQFIAHDLSFDPLPISTRSADPDLVHAFRTPAIDLDCLYGRGPRVESQLYSRDLPLSEVREEALRGYGFPVGRAHQAGGGLNPYELDLPRSTQNVVRVTDGLAAGIQQFDLRTLLREVLPAGSTDPDDLTERLEERIGRASKLRGTVQVRVSEKSLRRSVEDPFSTTWIELTDRLSFRGTAVGDDQERTFLANPTEILQEGPARIADPRNDENVLVAHIHLALSLLHNRLLRDVAERRPDLLPHEVFEEARRLCQWHFQYVVLHDFLEKLVGRGLAEEARRAARTPAALLHWRNRPFLPVEFAAGAFRAGHAMIRESYRLNPEARGGRPIAVFGPGPEEDLRGGKTLRALWSLQWEAFFGRKAQRSRRINHRIATPLLEFPVAGEEPFASILEMDILRGWKLGLPSGPSVARRLGHTPVTDEDLPLLLYVLLEAHQERDGKRLGPVGGTIVAHTLAGLVSGDPGSYLAREPELDPDA